MVLRRSAIAVSLVLPLWSSGPASAQTIADRGRVAWSGVYVGAHGGPGWADFSIIDGGTPITNPPYGAFACGPAVTGNYCDDSLDLGVKGAVGGVHLGINWQSGNLVFGLEGDLGATNLSAEKTLFRPNDADFASVKLDWYATLTGKLGLASDRSLYYVRGGAAFAQSEITAADMDLVGGKFAIYEGSAVRSDELLSGWVVGAGWEYALSSQLSFRAEYLYMDFGSFRARSSDGDIYDHDVTVQMAKVV